MSSIEVSGRGQAAGRPDLLSVVVSVSALRPTVAEAVTIASERARQLAELAGVTLGPVESITESAGGNSPAPRAAVMEKAAMATPLEPGQQSVTVRLSVTFSIAS